MDFDEEQFKQLWVEKGPTQSWKNFFWFMYLVDKDELATHNWCGNCAEDYPKRIKKNTKLYKNKYGN